MNKDFQDLGNGKIKLSNGLEISLDALINVAERSIKSESEIAERIAQQEFSREKLKHQAEQYKKIVESKKELLEMVEPFNKSKNDFMELAKAKAKEKQEKLLS